ncbi:biotin/lipoyl-containing protein [Asticcacaulis sp. AC466]|uniref:biotin/lipoyl-containing protein n=1 Tax=Asticcacaulis sp. AC466 TaxID=1282362 RepID=UPI001F38F413|nr:biotin/lipoyl-containing protein [Asticcacaulis sp. AC466]
MPALSPAMEKGALSDWYIKAGDLIVAGRSSVMIETEKATMEGESIHDGVVEEILVAESTENTPVNTPIVRMKAAEISQLTRETLRSQFHLSSLGIDDYYPEATHFSASHPCRSKVFVVHGHDELALEKLARFPPIQSL